MKKSKKEAIDNAYPFSLLPWNDRNDWLKFAECYLRSKDNIARQGNADALATMGKVFDEIASGHPLPEELEREFNRLLSGISPVYGKKSKRSYWVALEGSRLFHAIAEVAGELWAAVRKGEVGTLLQRCEECGMVRRFSRKPRKGDYACSTNCQDKRRYKRSKGKQPR